MTDPQHSLRMPLQPLRAVYAGTFDPITCGHEELLGRAAGLYDEIIIAIAQAKSKRPLFTLEERMAMAREALAAFPNVRVEVFTGLLVDFARTHQARVILRGIRGVVDFDYELQLANMNRAMAPEIETIFMTPTAQTQAISSTLVREIASMGGPVAQFVSPPVLARLQAKFAG